MKKIIIPILLCFILCVGCATVTDTATVSSQQMPSWVLNPSGKGYIGGVGISGTHINGKNAQRELAVSRALNDIARQMGVNIDNVLKTESRNTQNTSSVQMTSYSIHTVSGRTVSAKIQDIWENAATDEIYVYMRADE